MKTKQTSLIIDDNTYWLKLITRLVQALDYDVYTAQTYTEAIGIIKESRQPFDLTVTDVRLQDNDDLNIDGLELLRELRDRKLLRSSVIVTGYSNDIIRQVAKEMKSVLLEKGDFSRDEFWDQVKSLEQAEPNPLFNNSILEETPLLPTYVAIGQMLDDMKTKFRKNLNRINDPVMINYNYLTVNSRG